MQVSPEGCMYSGHVQSSTVVITLGDVTQAAKHTDLVNVWHAQVHGGLCVSAVFHFNQVGQVTRLTTSDRPR